MSVFRSANKKYLMVMEQPFGVTIPYKSTLLHKYL